MEGFAGSQTTFSKPQQDIRELLDFTRLLMNSRLMEKFYFTETNWSNSFNCKAHHASIGLVKNLGEAFSHVLL